MGKKTLILCLLLAWGFGWASATAVAASSPLVGAPTPTGNYATHGNAWENNSIGLTDAVPAPWTDLTYTESKVSCWGRDYDLGAGVMPRQITSQGRLLFARPPSLELVVDGIAVLGGSASAPVMTARDRHRAEYLIERKEPAFDLEARGTLDYDGFLKVTLTLVPKRATTIEKLIVTLPIARDVAAFTSRYIQYDFNAQRLDRADFSESISRIERPVEMRFNPAVWVGNHDVGIEWACETNAYWATADPARAIRLVPESGSVVMEVRMVDRPMRIQSPVSYAFALYPTPVKPLPPDWRNLAIVNAWSKPSSIDSKTHRIYGLGMLGRFPVRYPGLPAQEPGVSGIGRGPGANPEGAIRESRRKVDDLGIRYIPYGALYGMPARMPGNEWKEYGAAWRVMHPRSEVRNRAWARLEGIEEGEPSLITVCPWSRSFQDFLVWQYARAIERDRIQGMYLDLASPNFLCRNPNHPHGAFVAEGGEYYPFFAQRELLRRCYTAFKGKNPEFLIVQHHAKVPVVCSGFSDVVLSGEALNLFFGLGGGGRGSAPADYDPDYSLLPDSFYEVQYAQTRGFVSMLLPQIVKRNEETMRREAGGLERYTRILLARCAVYDIPVSAMRLDTGTYDAYLRTQQQFGWLSGARYLGPWDAPGFLLKGGDRFKVALYMKPGKAFIVISNLEKRDAETEVALNLPALAERGHRLPGDGKVTDAFTGATLSRADGTFRIQVPANDMRILILQ